MTRARPAFRLMFMTLSALWRCTRHHSKYSGDVFHWHAFVKQIAQRVHENAARFFPVQRLFEPFRMQQHARRALLVKLPVADAKWGSTRYVAMGTPRADLSAAANGIPRRIGPLDVAVCA